MTNTIDSSAIRADFPILSAKVRGRELVYLDNAASSQRPAQVIERIKHVYDAEYANIHRGVHFLSNQLSAEYERARERVAKFFGIADSGELLLTRGTTESINLVASAWGNANIQAGDTIAVTRAEHHSNFVPWQNLALRKQASFLIIDVDDDGSVNETSLTNILAQKPKVVALSLMSNVLGQVVDVQSIATQAKAAGALVVVDAAQGAAHMPVKVSDLGPIDFMACSAHKMCGPSGIGLLWGKREILEAMPPYQFGGGMISDVGDHETTWNRLPWKFEAGTPNIVGLIGWAEAVEYLDNIGMSTIFKIETELANHALKGMSDIPGLRVYGPGAGEQRSGVISFTIDGVHPADIGSFLDTQGIAVRVGHHCAQPLMRSRGIEGTCRASFYFYNTIAEADLFVAGLHKAMALFQG